MVALVVSFGQNLHSKEGRLPDDNGQLVLNEDEDEKEEKEEGDVLPLFWESAFFWSSQVQQIGTRYLEVLLNVPARYLEVLGFQVGEPD